ncbi:MAG: caspase family protein [Syntrophaceae bacterium]|nr:caspase family protein [Syntrophaceae bacterium]
MRYFRLLLILCLVTLFTYSSLYAAETPQKRGIQITAKPAPVTEGLYHQSHAVIIGINNYAKLSALEYATKDARAMEEKLKTLGFETVMLLDDQATRDSILKVLDEELVPKVQPNDRVIIFFAGNTKTMDQADGKQMGYLVPADADAENIPATSISMDQVRGISEKLPANHVLFLIDSCFAAPELAASGAALAGDRDYLQKITALKAHQMLTAGGSGETVQLTESGLSTFTAYILEGLDGLADGEGKGYVTFNDLASYVKQQVSRFAADKQVPQYGNLAGEGEMVFAVARQTAVTQAEVSEPVPAVTPSAEEAKMPETGALTLAEKQVQMEELKRLDEEKRQAEAEKMSLTAEEEEIGAPSQLGAGKPVQVEEQVRPAEAQQKTQVAMIPPSTFKLSEIRREGRFIAYNDGTVLDTKTNLMWAAKDNGFNINWQNAKSYCENYRGGGYKDWRMPTQDELASLYDEAMTNMTPPAIGCKGGYHLTNLIHLTCCCPWALETRGSKAAYFGFNKGPRAWLDESYVGGIRVLPVRTHK